MQVFWSNRGPAGFGYGSGFVGVVLVLIGVLLFVMPELLAYVVASVFVITGLGMLAAGWRMRQHVSYRRMDEGWPHRGDSW